jgi:hypothetical protein
MRETRNPYNIFMGRALGKRPFGWPRRISEDIKWILGRKVLTMEVDRTGSGLCPMAGFGISGVEPPGSATTALFSFV